MRPIFFFAFMLTLSVGFSQSKLELKLEALERQRFEAMTTTNLDFLGKVLSDNLAYTHSNGMFEDKQQHLDNIRSGKLVYKSMQPEEMKVRAHRKAAVITGIVNVTGVLNGKEFAVRLRYTDFYIKEKGGWKMAGWQSSRVEEAKK
jgi:Domain of unknown function (DUF4440)